jgi:hypothetical protein
MIKSTARSTLAKPTTRDLLKRSSNTPTYGPTTEYGSNTTLKAAAAATALGCRSGEKSTKDASAD